MENETSINNFFLSDGQTALPKLTHGSLFSGIGGFDLAAHWIGWENIFQCEIDEYCKRVLNKNFPNVTKFSDIKDFNGTEYTNRIDVLSGGFPCQPFSVAGKRKGKLDDRYLWHQMLRVISEIKPSFIVGENVAGIIPMELDNIINDLEEQGYTAEPFVIPACAVDAKHRRDRVWILAYNKSSRWYSEALEKLDNKENNRKEGCGFDNICKAQNEKLRWQPEPELGRVVYGIPDRMDRLKGLGNSIVPQVAFEIFTAIDFVLREGKKIINTVQTAHTTL